MKKKKLSYKDQLLTDNWARKRLKIFKRDNFKCVKCNSKATEVHHKKYMNGKNAWDVPDSFLQSLCRGCHIKAHIGVDIKKLVVRYQAATPAVKNKRRIDRLLKSLSESELEIQRRYDRLKS